MTRRRRAVISTVSMIVLGAVLSGFGWWALGTQGGTHWTFERLGGFLPGELDADSLIGPIRGPLVGVNVRYMSPTVEIKIRRMTLDWNLHRVFANHLDVRTLAADHVRVQFFRDPSQVPDTSGALPDFDLPLRITIARAHLRDVHVTLIGADTALVFDHAELTNVGFHDSLHIGRAVVHSPNFDGEIRGGTRTIGRYAGRFDAAWTWRVPGRTAVSGHGPMFGDLDSLRVVQDVTGPGRARLDATVYRILYGSSVRATVDFTGARPGALNRAWPPGPVSGRLALTGPTQTFHAAGTMHGTFAAGGPASIAFTADRDRNVIAVTHATLTRPDRRERLVAHGTIRLVKPEPQVDLTGRWTSLALGEGQNQFTSPTGTFRARGPLSRVGFGFRGVIDANHALIAGPVEVTGTGDAKKVNVRSIDAKLLGGRVTGTATLDFSHSVAWNVDLHVRDLDPSTRWPAYPGSVSFDVKGHGFSHQNVNQGDLTIANLAGAVREQPVAGQAAFAFAPGRIAFRTLDLAWGDSRLTAKGAYGGPWDLQANLDVPDLGLPVPGGSGGLHATVATGGSNHHRLVAVASADSLHWKSGAIRQLAGVADLDLENRARSKVDFQATGMRNGDASIDRARLTGDGFVREHKLELIAARGVDSLRMAAAGGWSARQWQGSVTGLDLASAGLGAWGLERPAAVIASLSHIRVQELAWRQGPARVSGAIDWQRTGPWSASAKLEQVPLRMLEPWLVSGVTLEGPANGTARFGADASHRSFAEADVTIGPGAVTYARGAGTGRLRLDPGTVRVRSDAAGIQAAAQLTSPDAGRLDGTLRLGAASGPARTVAGTLRVQIDSLGFLPAFVPGVSATGGRFAGDLMLGGTVGEPRFGGSVQLTNGFANITRLGVLARDVGLTARGDANGALAIHAEATTETGKATLDGEGRFGPGGWPIVRGTVRGDRVLVMNNRDGRLVVSPDATFVVAGDSLAIRGDIVVPEGKLATAQKSDKLARPSRDVEVVQGELPKHDYHLYADTRVVLGDQVEIDAYGLKGTAEGSLLVYDRPGWPASATGELRMNAGTYRAYGQDLQIERGRLIYGGGPIKNPGLDIRVSRTASDGVVAGFEVGGTLLEPSLTVFSVPAMASRDALAYVLFGRPLDRATQSEAGIANDAAAALGLRGGAFLASKLGESVGLDEVSVQSKGGLDEASLMLGTYLSPKVYVNYGIGILDQVSTLKVRYILDRNWTVQAESGIETRGQIQYTVEK
jgi:translocation and assembly module TamB